MSSTASFLLSFPIVYRTIAIVIGLTLLQVVASHLKIHDKENKRRLQHAASGLALVQGTYILPLWIGIPVAFVTAIVIAILQIYVPVTFRKVFGGLLRPNEYSGKQMVGSVYFMLGAGLTGLLVSDINITRYAIECLSLADPMASLFGTRIKSRKIKLFKGQTATVSGCLACFVTAFIIGYYRFCINKTTTTTAAIEYVTTFSSSSSANMKIFLGALTCMIAEMLPFVNDNLMIPLSTGLVMQYLNEL